MRQLHKYWAGLFVRGIIAIIFGVIALSAPALGLTLLVLLFGAFAFVDGLVASIVGFTSKSPAFIVEGLVGILIGLYVFFFPAQAVLVFLLLIAVWAIITGVFELIAAVELRKHIANEIWLLFVGVVSILFGVLVFVNPVTFALALTVVIGIYAIVFGVFLIALSLKVKNYRTKTKKSKKRKR